MTLLIKNLYQEDERLKSLLFFIGGAYFVLGVLALGVAASTLVYGPASDWQALADVLSPVGFHVFFSVMGLIFCSITYGFWTGKKWGLNLAILTSTIWVIYIIRDFQARKTNLGGLAAFSLVDWVYYSSLFLTLIGIIWICLLPRSKKLIAKIVLKKSDGSEVI